MQPPWVLPRSHPALGVTLPLEEEEEESRAAARPGGASPLSPVCPSQAVSSDFDRIWVICCSNYQIAFAHPGTRRGSSWAAGAEACAGADALRAAGHGAFTSTQGRCRLRPSKAGSCGAGGWVLEGVRPPAWRWEERFLRCNRCRPRRRRSSARCAGFSPGRGAAVPGVQWGRPGSRPGGQRGVAPASVGVQICGMEPVRPMWLAATLQSQTRACRPPFHSQGAGWGFVQPDQRHHLSWGVFQHTPSG